MKALKPSAELAAIVGAAPLPRTEVIKKIWEYIKAHNLQNPAKEQYPVRRKTEGCSRQARSDNV